MTRLILPAILLLAVAGCNRVDPWGTTPGASTANPPVRAMPGPGTAGAAQPFEDPGTRPPSNPFGTRR